MLTPQRNVCQAEQMLEARFVSWNLSRTSHLTLTVRMFFAETADVISAPPALFWAIKIGCAFCSESPPKKNKNNRNSLIGVFDFTNRSWWHSQKQDEQPRCCTTWRSGNERGKGRVPCLSGPHGHVASEFSSVLGSRTQCREAVSWSPAS